MKLQHIMIGKRTFALAFTLDALQELQTAVPDFDLSKVADLARSPGGLADLITAMARQGELLEGRTLDVDRAWFGSHISPAPVRVAKLQIAALDALAEGMRMETEDEDGDAEHDVVLDELKKKGSAG